MLSLDLQQPGLVMDSLTQFILIAIFVALACAGFVRPTGLLGRSRADEETECQRDAAARVLGKAEESSERSPDD
jgi:hypothetical protein